MEDDFLLMVLFSLILSVSFVTMLAACLCCRRKVPKNELLGLEGMVKLKNPDENINGINAGENVSLKSASAAELESKRASNAPHRSLPDIPVTEPARVTGTGGGVSGGGGDTGSDLYATVGDKVFDKPQGRNLVNVNTSKLTSISQHSSLSQADDVSSPYARVRSLAHDYDKVLPAEHPYAQLKTIPGQLSDATQTSNLPSDDIENPLLLRRENSNKSILETIDGHLVIPAASAIAGRISASQELPYMTPPIIPNLQQNFSGDSQDSSKGYTSISVREPLANIIAQTNQQNAMTRRRNLTDSHYATVSDDSDEMYAAIDDPKNQVELYNSGSETYAQIQPPMSLMVSVEINTIPNQIRQYEEDDIITANLSALSNSVQRQSAISNPEDTIPPIPQTIENLRTVHSRQASSSSCTSSVGILGSPKPEKRQANSPLPPTPKNQHHLSNSNLTNTSSIPSGRNSAASIVECSSAVGVGAVASVHNRQSMSGENIPAEIPIKNENLSSNNNRSQEKFAANDDDIEKRKAGLSKDLEGMYAKVMKKSKFFNILSNNESPDSGRNLSQHYHHLNDYGNNFNLFSSDPDLSTNNQAGLIPIIKPPIHQQSTTVVDDHTKYETIGSNLTTNLSIVNNSKDPGYETISTTINTIITSTTETNSKSCDLSEPRYESLPHMRPDGSDCDPGYETVSLATTELRQSNSDYDPNYEVLRPTELSDHGKLSAKEKNTDYLKNKPQDNSYLSVKRKDRGYCTITDYDNDKPTGSMILNHDYASIAERIFTNNKTDNIESVTNSTVPQPVISSGITIPSQDPIHHNYLTIFESQNLRTNYSNDYQCSISHSIITTIDVVNKQTTPSSDSNSSVDIQIGYNSIRSTNNDDSQINSSNSNYESLTGSESEPNYESVRYVGGDADGEIFGGEDNPYERLYNESVNFMLDHQSPVSPVINNDDTVTATITVAENVLSVTTSANLIAGAEAITVTSIPGTCTNNDSLEVGDYFQV